MSPEFINANGMILRTFFRLFAGAFLSPPPGGFNYGRVHGRAQLMFDFAPPRGIMKPSKTTEDRNGLGR
jgi:hypothetical protein